MFNCLPALLADARRLLPPHDEEGLDVVVGEELVAVAAATRLDVERVVKALEGGARYVHSPGKKITFSDATSSPNSIFELNI